MKADIDPGYRQLYVAFENVTGEADYAGDSFEDVEVQVAGMLDSYTIVGPWVKLAEAAPMPRAATEGFTCEYCGCAKADHAMPCPVPCPSTDAERGRAFIGEPGSRQEKISEGGTNMRAAGEKPDPEGPAGGMAGERSEQPNHEGAGRAGQVATAVHGAGSPARNAGPVRACIDAGECQRKAIEERVRRETIEACAVVARNMSAHTLGERALREDTVVHIMALATADSVSVEDSPCAHEWVAGRSKPIVCQHCGIRRAEWVAEQIRADQRSADGPLVMMRSAGHNEPDDHGAEDLLPVFVRCFACASQQPEVACSRWVGIGWSCVDRKACRARRATPDDPPTPTQALDGLFNGAVSGGIGGVHGAEMFNIVRKAMSEPYDGSFDRLGDIIDEGFGIQPVMSRSEKLTFLEARLAEQMYSRDEHVAALEAMEDSAMACAAHLIAKWLRRYADEHSGSHPANAGHIACNAAASAIERGEWKK